jgi:glyoxylate/hydroxypyruvate reductase A
MRIAFISTLSMASQDLWLQALRAELLSGHDVVRSSEVEDVGTIDVVAVAGPIREELGRFPRVRLVQSLWAGVDMILATGSIPLGVPVCRVVDHGQIASMVRTAVSHCLSIYLRLPEYREFQAKGRWEPLPLEHLSKKPICVLGLGSFGAPVALALSRLGFTVLGWRRSRQETIGDVTQFTGREQLGEALRDAFIVVNLLPLTADTFKILNARTFLSMPVGAAVINLSRGAHVEEDDLRDALDCGQLSYAVLDVFSIEPIPEAHWAWQHPRTIVTPHVAAQIDSVAAARTLASNVEALCHGGNLLNVVRRDLGY